MAESVAGLSAHSFIVEYEQATTFRINLRIIYDE